MKEKASRCCYMVFNQYRVKNSASRWEEVVGFLT